MLELLDITARKQAEAALTEREDQLRQAQKLEAVGRLAGGIAHGFNNLLAVIMGRSEMLRDCLAPDDPRRRDVEQIHGASIQGAWLTRQLLTFSRKQVATPETVDLRAVVREMEEMLRCVLSEEVELVVAPGGRPANVHIDRPQIEQVLLNLVINARDAMPRGGVITVELTHIERPDRATRDASPLGPGRYVQLAVRDDGTGMDESTRSRLFEPFFTTKGADHGSGLGLSIVYGTITQAGGHVEVASEVGLGTTFKIFLPRQDGMPAKTNLPAADAVTGGDETILVVEDDDSVRAVTHEALAIEGYTVLTASGGREALDLVERHRGPLHMLVTDVVMPQMGGGELAQRLTAVRPDLRVLYVSGYADDAIVRQGVAESGAPFLQKPFSLESLALKVREVLDARLGAARDASSEPRRRNG